MTFPAPYPIKVCAECGEPWIGRGLIGFAVPAREFAGEQNCDCPSGKWGKMEVKDILVALKEMMPDGPIPFEDMKKLELFKP